MGAFFLVLILLKLERIQTVQQHGLYGAMRLTLPKLCTQTDDLFIFSFLSYMTTNSSAIAYFIKYFSANIPVFCTERYERYEFIACWKKTKKPRKTSIFLSHDLETNTLS